MAADKTGIKLPPPIAWLVSKTPLSKIIDGKSLVQLKRYIITGLITFSVEYISFILLLGYFNNNASASSILPDLLKGSFLAFPMEASPYISANSVVYIIVFWLNFLLNRFWSFSARGNFGRQLFLYGVLFVINLFAINGLLYVFTDLAGINPLISKVLVMGAVICWNFILYKKVIYR